MSSYNETYPNAGQSPGLFPAQGQTNWLRLKDIINADHNFLDSSVDSQGAHNQVTFIDRADPTSVPSGTSSILYGKTAADAANEVWFYDGSNARQLNWRETAGSLSVTGSFQSITTVPVNVFGYIFMYKGLFVQTGSFISNGSSVNGYSDSIKYENGTGARQILSLGFAGEGASGLSLRVKNARSSSFNGTWTWKIFYRKV